MSSKTSIEDDGTRAAAVAMIGEDAVHAAEVETVKNNAALGADMFRRMGISESAISEGLNAAATGAWWE